MATAYTPLLGLALPAIGQANWGSTVNDQLTSLVDSAVAGTTTLSSDADVTLTSASGTANQSRQAIVLWTAGGTATRTITAPAQSKAYCVINKTSSTQSIVFKATGQTGVTIVANEACVVAFNGTDFIKVASNQIGNLSGILSVANGGTGVATITGLLKGTGTTPVVAAVSGTDYAPATVGSSILSGNGSGGFSNVTIGTGLTFAGGTLASTAGTGSVTSVNVSGGTTGLGFSGGPITTSGTMTMSGTLNVANGGTGQTSFVNGELLIGNTTGNTLTKSTLTAGSGVSITNGNGSITISATGSGGTVTGVSAVAPVASSGGTTPQISLNSGYGDTQNPYGSKTSNSFLAAPSAGSGAPSFRSIVAADIPTLNQNTTGSAGSVVNSITFKDDGSGGSGVLPGTIYNGSVARTISYNTVGAPSISGANATGTWGISVTGSAGYAATAGTASSVSGTVQVANGGTGVTTITGLVKGNGTSSFSAAIAGTDYAAAPTGTNAQLLANNGSGGFTNVTVGSGLSYSGGSLTATGGGGSVTSVGLTVPTGFSVSNTPITGSGDIALSFAANYSLPTNTKQGQWDDAYNERLRWDGGSTGLSAPTGRTSLGATTVGSNFFTLTNPSAVTFPRMNADNTVSALSDSAFRSAIGAGTGNGTVTSVSGTGTVNGLTLSGTVTGSGNITLGGTLSGIANSATTATSANTASAIVARDASGNFSAGTITATLSGTATQVSNSLTLGVSGTGLSGSATFNGASAQTFTVTSNATSSNTASTIVARDASGNFTAGTITATLSGNATSATSVSGTSSNGYGTRTVSTSGPTGGSDGDIWYQY